MDIFDASFYKSSHPDLSSLSDEQARNHWFTYGWRERRRINPGQDLESYLVRYADLRNAFWIKGSHLKAYQHFLSHGYAEGRSASLIPHSDISALLWDDCGYGKISTSNTLARVGMNVFSPNVRETRIGIIDTGVTGDYLKFYLNDPPNGVDDDGNGIVDDNLGYDTFDQDVDPSDPYGHGTAVANVIHAFSPGNPITAIKVGGQDGNGTNQSLVQGILYAVNEQIPVINISMGTTEGNPEMESAIAQACSAGIIVVCSAHNFGGYPMGYPAMYTEKYKNVIAVGATEESNDLLYSGDNWASCHASPTKKGNFVTAKGKNVTETNSWMKEGTSFAAPQITALIANLMSKAYAPLGVDVIIDCLTMSCSNILP
jgi:hypothetical protein